MSKIKIPTGYVEKDIEELTDKDISSLFEASSSVLALQQYALEKSLTKEEILEIISVKISCDKIKGNEKT